MTKAMGIPRTRRKTSRALPRIPAVIGVHCSLLEFSKRVEEINQKFQPEKESSHSNQQPEGILRNSQHV